MSSAQTAKDRTLIAVIGDEVSLALLPSLFTADTLVCKGLHYGAAPRRDRTR